MHFKKIQYFTFSILLVISLIDAQEALVEVDVGNRIGKLRHVIDFFPGYENTSEFKALKPRYVVPFAGRASSVDGIRAVGCEPVLSLHYNDRARTTTVVSDGKKKNVKHYVLWTEPNRTWISSTGGTGENIWLDSTKTTWQSFLLHSVEMYKGAKAADSNCLISAPCISMDDTPKHDPNWLLHLKQFLDHWASNNCKVDYVNAHPPYEPDQVYTLGAIAKAYSTLHPNLGIKGVSIGEYPFYLDSLAVHLRFFIAFEEIGVEFAAKSNYRTNCCNSGVLTESGAKLPLYWLFYQYVTMPDIRLKATHGGAINKVQVLGSYDSTKKTATIIVGNDENVDQNVTLRVKSVTGNARMVISRFASAGIIPVKDSTITPNSGVYSINFGVIKKTSAMVVTLTFDNQQSTNVAYRPLTITKTNYQINNLLGNSPSLNFLLGSKQSGSKNLLGRNVIRLHENQKDYSIYKR